MGFFLVFFEIFLSGVAAEGKTEILSFNKGDDGSSALENVVILER